jgi:CHRD domain-containing protein
MRLKLLSVAALAVALAALLLAGSVFAGGRPLRATLTGAAEAPGPGDPDGSGKVTLKLNQGRHRVCFAFEYQNIDPPTAGHVHVAPVGQPGPVVVPLFGPPAGPPADNKGCVNGVRRALIKTIRRHPGNYYVNLHNASYPDGAIRGQLSKKKPKENK